MEVINRKQITEVTARRQVSHTIELNGVRYIRRCEAKMLIPFMDCEFKTIEEKITWQVYTAKNVLSDLTKKEIALLKLEELFQGLDINTKNGNNF